MNKITSLLIALCVSMPIFAQEEPFETVITPAFSPITWERLLNAGDLTVGEVMGRLIDDGANVFSAADLMDTIFFAGLLEEPDMAAAGAAPAEELAVATPA